MHALVAVCVSFICIYVLYLAGNFKKYKKEAVAKVCYFIFQVVVAHNAVNRLDTVSSGDVKQSTE